MIHEKDVERAKAAEETTPERLERMAKEKRDRLDQQLHESSGWAKWRGLKPKWRIVIAGAVGFVVILIIMVVAN